MGKNKLVLFTLAFLLAVTGAFLQVKTSLVFAAGEGETLTIKGDGVEKEITFTRSELEAMEEAIVQHEYSSTNNFPTEKNFYRKGVSLDHLLKLAGIKDSAKQVKFISSDGYTKSFTKDELMEDVRYCFKADGEKIKVPNILAFSDSSKGFSSLEPLELSLTLGQRVKGEQNNPWFVKYLKTIEVIGEEPGQWEPVGFSKTPGPDGVSVTLSHPRMDSVKIYYTLDGSKPDINGKVYNVSATYYQPQLNKPILAVKDTEVRAIAIGPGKNPSVVSSSTVSFGSSGFTDISGYPWAKIAIENLTEKKIINGMGNGKFAPEQNLTRAQFATMMVLAMGETPYSAGTQPVSSGFNDVKYTDWHFGYVKKAAEKGWIKGYTDGSFKPERPLSREEMLTIAVQVVKKGDLSESQTNGVLESFSPNSKISDWAKPYVAAAEQMSIIEHGNIIIESLEGLVLDAQKHASRAEAAVTVYKLINEVT